jgi:L-asparaginase
MKILFIQTGGTIDKDYSKVFQAYNFDINDPAVERILDKVNPSFEFEIMSLLKKDSMDMNDEDRELIRKTCQNSDSSKIIITHGTDTMVETARVLSDIKNKVIILTGSARPERFSNSDATFNIGVAVGALNVVDEGVFVAMNGVLRSFDTVIKNPETGQFVQN